MRTTLDIDADVLMAVKERALRENKTTGRVISELTRKALIGQTRAPAYRSGFRPFGSRRRVVTNTRINKLRDESGS